MTLRISTLWAQQMAVNQMLDNQSKLATIQQQVASGKRLVSPASDPAASARALNLTHYETAINQYQRNMDTGNSRLGIEDQALTSTVKVLQSVRSLTLEGMNATQSATSRQNVATQIREQLKQILQIANTQDAGGGYIFAGNSIHTQPFVQGVGGVTYQGDQGQRRIAIAAGQTVAIGDPGSQVFQQISTGNGRFAVHAAAANQGTAVIGATSLSNPTLWKGGSYTLQFTAPNSYQVLDAGNNVVSRGSYHAGDTISFQGISLTLSGTPIAGDNFQIGPSSHQSVFSTVQSIVKTLTSSGVTGTQRAQFEQQINGQLNNLDQALNRLVNVRA
ncbi:MAG TPA: flagellar hook-associated protein 3, partial [Mizugakiibacter sp.]|nr:flagellar hook-associated protein 3 [Mizugakiibacter sp.]